ncbi:MAG TPA: AAA family ATPase, partial [Thermoanaerobaculia bacterium]|nr:AAA family ATPase [Thermoanaerobaculia bacterium]
RRRLDLIRAYRVDANSTSFESEAVRQAAQWLVGEASTLASERLGEVALQRFGGDLRLGLLFRQLTRGQDLTTGTLEEILRGLFQSTAALEVLRSDLEGFPPEAVHLLMIAACSHTTIRFAEAAQGLLAAETVYSTAAGGRKGRPILIDGQRIDAHALESLRSDRETRTRSLVVEGYSRKHPSSIREGIDHLALFLGTDTEVERMGKLIVEIGTAELNEGIILARSPYWELIRDAVDQKQPPAEVYQLLSGGPSPLAAWNLPLFARLTADKIQEIDARIDEHQASMLQLLGTTWHALAERRSFPENHLRRALTTLTGRDVEWVAGSGKIFDRIPRWEGDNWDLLFALGEPQSQRESPYYFLILAAPEKAGLEPEPAPQLLEALMKVGAGDEGTEGQNKDQTRPSLLLVARPGERSIGKRERRWIELSDEELRTAALNPEWVKAFWGLVKARAGLKALAPFKREGALPPGSPVFAGREEELRYMIRHLRERSFLIVGSRQVGKTSLLNELRFRVQNYNDIACFYMDLQGISHSDELTGNLVDWSGASEIRTLRSRELFTHLVEAASKENRFPVFLLNEIDVLLREEVSFLWFLRGLHDATRAQFVMTGYTQAAAACQDPTTPFYHWTTSPDRKRKYLAIAELTPRAAEQIVEVLEKPPLELVWNSPQEKLRGQRLILDRSYRIPHLVQAICLGLVERLEENRRYSLRYDDVIAVVGQREISAWDRVLNIDFSFAAPNVPHPELARALVQLVLLTAMKNLYFSGARPLIHDQLLPARDHSTVSFSAEEVHRWLPQSLKGFLIASELAEANRLINQVDIDAMLSALTLTLVLSYDLKTGRYSFPGHLYPRELKRNLRPGELIEDRIIELVLHFAYFLPAPGAPWPNLLLSKREGI